MGWGDLGTGSVLRGTGDAALTGIDDLAWGEGPDGPVLYASSGAGGALSAWSLGAGGDLDPLDRAALPSTASAGTGGEVVLVGGASPMAASTGVAGSGLVAFDLEASGGFGAKATLAPAGGALPTDLCGGLSVQVGGTTYLYGLRLGSERVSAWKVGADGALTTLSNPTPSAPASSGAGLADLASVTRGGATFLLGASSSGDALICWQVAANGVPVETGRVMAAQGVGIDAPAAVATVTLGDRAFAIMASAGSSSLTVAEVRADGTLVVTDHLIDDLGTRFDGACHVSACQVGSRAFLAVAGCDNGVSLFEVLPGGRLLLLSTVADTTGTTLSGITALALTAHGGELQVAVASGSEPGITLLTAPLPAGGVTKTGTTGNDALAGTSGDDRLDGGSGADTLTGTLGDDVLMDGAGADRLSGGGGEDVFVLAADGEADTVTDFQLGVDRIDLSGWSGLRSSSQLVVRTTSNGAEIAFGTETLRIETMDGRPLTEAEVRALDLVPVTRAVPSASSSTTPRTLTGGDGADVLKGANGPDKLYGYGGNDTLEGLAGADSAYGGEGLDRILGGEGDDTAWGGAGADDLQLGAGRDRAYGEDGDDVAWGGTEDDSLWGGAGHDTLRGEDGADRLQADDGNDSLLGGGGNDSLLGNAGRDRLWGEAHEDRLDGGSEDDLLYGGDGNDWLSEAAGLGSLWGGRGNDTLYGGTGNDWLAGEDGHDLLYGDTERDSLYGGAGLDTLSGGDGDDLVSGGTADDVLRGDHGNDHLIGEGGHDHLDGGGGDDRVNGDGGNDRLTGGSGSDSFVFSSGKDTVVDFQNNVDTIVLDDGLWGGGSRTPQQMLSYARVTSGGDLLFTFPNGATLLVENVTDPNLLLDDLAVG